MDIGRADHRIELSPSDTYDRKFYDIVSGTALPSARRVVPHIVQWLHPTRVIDIGCGEGAWLIEFLRLGCHVVGVDGKFVEKGRLLIPLPTFVQRDLELPLTDVVSDFAFDLALSLEVAEHLSAHRAEGFVDDLVSFSDRVLFSAAIPGQGGYGHINEQPHQYWIRMFEDRGYAVTTVLQRRFANDPEVASWYRSNMLLFVKVSGR